MSIKTALGTLGAIALLASSACGGQAEGSEIASAGGDANPAEEAENTDALDDDAQALEFAECMRDNGIDMPDPEPGQEGLMGALRAPMGGDHSASAMAELQQAIEACDELMPTFKTRDHDGPDQEAMLQLAECLRDEGLDVPDDMFGGDAMHDIDRDELLAAMEHCRNVAGFPGGPGQGGQG